MNDQTARNDSTLLDYSRIDHATIYRQILDSDAFNDWVFEKTFQEGVAFFNIEHALYEYVHELACSSPLQAFPCQPHDLGMFAELLSCVQNPVLTIRGLFPMY